MRLLLDTNTLLWTLAGSPRIRAVEAEILASDTEVFVSAVSWWEIAVKISIGKLPADLSELREAASTSGFLELAVTGRHADALVKLPVLHRDPFDRMLVAQAVAEPMRLLTGDATLGHYSELVQVF